MANILFLHPHTNGRVVRLQSREVIILAISVILSVLVLFTGISIVPRVGILAVVLGSGMMLALGRDVQSGATLEAKIYHVYKALVAGDGDYTSMGRFSTRSDDSHAIDGSPNWYIDLGTILRSGSENRELWVTPIPITVKNLLLIPTISILFMGLVWAWSGGI